MLQPFFILSHKACDGENHRLCAFDYVHASHNEYVVFIY